MQKISSQDAKTILKQASAAIRHLTGKNIELHTKLAQVEKDQRIAKLAQEMESKGLNADTCFEDKVASLQTANLDVTEEAVKLAAPSMSLGMVTDMPGNAIHPFENFILTGEHSE